MMTDQFVTEIPQSGGFDTRANRPPTSQGLEIRIVDSASDPSWDRLVTSHPCFTFFHSSAWIRVLCKTYGHKALARYSSQHDKPKALIPLVEIASRFTGCRGVSLPFTASCDPLIFGDCDTGIVFKTLRSLAWERGWKHFEIRGRLASHLPSQPSTVFHGHSLDLSDGAEVLFKKFASSVRRAIRKAERSGVTVRLNTSEEAMREFYRLHAHTRRRHGLPPQPFSFFQNIYREVIKAGLGFVALANHGSKTIAAAVYFHIEKKAVFKFGASDERYQDLRPITSSCACHPASRTERRRDTSPRSNLTSQRRLKTIQAVLGRNGGTN